MTQNEPKVCESGSVWPEGDPRRCAGAATRISVLPGEGSPVYACDEHAAPSMVWTATNPPTCSGCGAPNDGVACECTETP